MANNYLGKNFTTSTNDGVVTKYLNLQGLTDFWAKAKGYIDAQDTKLFNAAKAKIDANDAAIRNYVESLTVNGVKVSSTKDEVSGLGTELAVTINAGHIAIDYNGKDNDLQNQTIQTAITDVPHSHRANTRQILPFSAKFIESVVYFRYRMQR